MWAFGVHDAKQFLLYFKIHVGNGAAIRLLPLLDGAGSEPRRSDGIGRIRESQGEVQVSAVRHPGPLSRVERSLSTATGIIRWRHIASLGVRATSWRRRIVVILCTVALLWTVVPAAVAVPENRRPVDHLQVAGGQIVDGHGRTVLLRGVNVNQLGDYFQPNPAVPATVPLTERDFERIAALGMNTVRLLVHWSRLEPEPGMRDPHYLAEIKQAVEWAEDAGIFVILDMHQDAWSKYVATDPDEMCPPPLSHAKGWDGAPEWATFTDGLPRCMMQQREFSLAVAQAFESFWLDRPAPDGIGIQQHLVDTWAWLAGEFAGTPTVIGYDLLNEPNPGFTPVVTDITFLGEFYRRALSAIRDAEAGGLTKIVFFEPMATWSATSVGIPRPFATDTQIVYAPHIYTGSLNVDRAALGQELISMRTGFEQARREADLYDTTFFSGEWGFWGSAAETATYMRRYAALEDEFQIGGTIWQWKQACGDPHSASYPDGRIPETSGNVVVLRCGDEANPAGVDVGLVEDTAFVLSRPYPRRFPGTAQFSWDPDTRHFLISGQYVAHSKSIELWVPGETEPVVVLDGLAFKAQQQVEGGWIIHLEPVQNIWHAEVDHS